MKCSSEEEEEDKKEPGVENPDKRLNLWTIYSAGKPDFGEQNCGVWKTGEERTPGKQNLK